DDLSDARAYGAQSGGDGDIDAPQDIPGLIAYYPMEDDPSNGAADATGNGHDSVCVNGCPFGQAGRVGNGAYSFNTNRYLRVANAPVFQNLAAFTVALWMRGNANGGYSGIAKTVG